MHVRQTHGAALGCTPTAPTAAAAAAAALAAALAALTAATTSAAALAALAALYAAGRRLQESAQPWELEVEMAQQRRQRGHL